MLIAEVQKKPPKLLGVEKILNSKHVTKGYNCK